MALSRRHCERSEAIHGSARGEMDCFAALAMTDIATRSSSRSQLARDRLNTLRVLAAIRPRFASSFALSQIRGRREDRVLAAPAVSRAICANKSAHEHTGQREHSGLPCAMALRLTSCSPRRTALLPPLSRRSFASPGLNASTAASEPHDFAVRFRRVRLVAPSASIASHRAFVTMANAPHLRETGGVMQLIWVRTKAEYF